METFKEMVYQTQDHLPTWWLDKYGGFFHNNLYERFSDLMLRYYCNNDLLKTQQPFFEEEVKTDKHSAYKLIEPVIEAVESKSFNKEIETKKLGQLFVDIPFSEILLLSGQRLTSASIKDERAIPPKKEELVSNCFLPHNSQISIVTRAWEKHVGRNNSKFWGQIKGSPKQKEMFVRVLLSHFFSNYTWWNVFYHYKHELVYEIRIKSGQGMRWRLNDLNFIGFLEPFV